PSASYASQLYSLYLHAALPISQDTVKLGDYVNLKPRLFGDKLNLTDDGVLITEKFADLLGVSVGDMITLKDDKTATPDTPSKSADRKSTRLNSSHVSISYAVYC